MTEKLAKDQANKWEFHFRNFDDADRWFACYHAGCGMAPWHESRPKCWATIIAENATGGGNDVYVPSDWVVNYDQWFKVVLDVLVEIEAIGVAIATDGSDLGPAISGALRISGDIVQASLVNSGEDLSTLQANAVSAFNNHCNAIGRAPSNIRDIASQMGLTNYGFVAGDSYQHLIHNNNNYINNGHGWTILRSPGRHHHPDKIANAAFVSNGHLIYYWNSSDSAGFWNDFN